MTGRRRSIGRTPPSTGRPPPGAGGRRSVFARCRWCPAEIMWLEHSTTHKLAPIDVDPQPGGNVLVHRTAAGKVAGTYSVLGGEERGLFDATEAVDRDARPTLHLNHWATCQSPTARRLAKERAGGKTGPVVAADDDATQVGQGDLLDAPAHVTGPRLCASCGQPMDPALLEAEPDTTTHPGCPTKEG